MKNSELHFISRLSDYSMQSILLRIGMVSVVGLLFLFLSTRIAGDGEIMVTALEYFQVILVFNIISESNVLLDHLAERFLPIPEKISLRVVLHFGVSLLLFILAVSYFALIVKDALFFSHPIVQLMMFLGLIFIFILTLVSVTLRIIEKWIFSSKQLEELKSSKLKSDYHSLQAQLNPHFLFNNLSVLKSMITYDPGAAIHFTQNFTDVYRYVLQSKDKTTVKLQEELEFIEAYIAIHKERLGEAIDVATAVNEDLLKRELPPLSLQLLVENAVKHNIASMEEPLHLEICSRGIHLRVINNVNPKESVFSERTGLENLTRRYQMLTSDPVVIKPERDRFEVEIPLL